MRKFYQWNAHQILERRTHSDFTKLNSLWGNDFVNNPRSTPDRWSLSSASYWDAVFIYLKLFSCRLTNYTFLNVFIFIKTRKKLNKIAYPIQHIHICTIIIIGVPSYRAHWTKMTWKGTVLLCILLLSMTITNITMLECIILKGLVVIHITKE